MPEERFEDVMKAERERLHREREAVLAEQRELVKKLAAISRGLSAIDAYEAARTGKALSPARQSGARRAPRAARGSRREGVLQVIRENGAGLTRGEILERMGLKGDKSGEMSVSNALTALIKSNQVARRERRYRVV
jgi:hypothetical protein